MNVAKFHALQKTNKKFVSKVNKLKKEGHTFPFSEDLTERMAENYVYVYSDKSLSVKHTNSRFDAFAIRNDSAKRFEKNKILLQVQKHSNKQNGIFFTITNNIHDKGLEEQYRELNKSFRKFYKSADYKNNFWGHIKNTEITLNNDKWNVHLHIILLPKKNYFKKTNSRYLNKETAVKWFNGYIDLKSINTDSKKAIFEISKYTAKSFSVVNFSDEKFLEYTHFLHNKRLVEYSIPKKLKQWFKIKLAMVKRDWKKEEKQKVLLDSFLLSSFKELKFERILNLTSKYEWNEEIKALQKETHYDDSWIEEFSKELEGIVNSFTKVPHTTTKAGMPF